jgi:hypothetical protein
MKLDFSLVLPDILHDELVSAAKACGVTTRDFAGQCLEVALASRRLPKVYVPKLTQGARMTGGGHEDETEAGDQEAQLIEHPVVSPLHAV